MQSSSFSFGRGSAFLLVRRLFRFVHLLNVLLRRTLNRKQTWQVIGVFCRQENSRISAPKSDVAYIIGITFFPYFWQTLHHIREDGYCGFQLHRRIMLFVFPVHQLLICVVYVARQLISLSPQLWQCISELSDKQTWPLTLIFCMHYSTRRFNSLPVRSVASVLFAQFIISPWKWHQLRRLDAGGRRTATRLTGRRRESNRIT